MSSLTRRIFLAWIVATAISFAAASTAQGQDANPKPSGSISGQVTIGSKPVAGIPVAAFSLDTINRRIAAAQSVTDTEGHYRLAGLSPGQYQVATLTPDLTTGDSRSDLNYGFALFNSSKSIVLAAAEDVEDIDLKLVRGGVITGRVTDAENRPVIEERVSLQPVDDNGNPSRQTVRLPLNNQMYQTDDRGIYRIYGLPAAHYKVSVGSNTSNGIVSFNNRGYYPRTFYPDVSDQARATVIELAEGEIANNIDIKVGSPADSYAVSGRVIDSDTGAPVPGARIGLIVAPKDQPRASTPVYNGLATNDRGEFKFEGLAPGHYGAYVTSEYEGGDFYSDPVYFDISDENVSGIEIKATRGLSLSGVVAVGGENPKVAAAQLGGLRISANGVYDSSRLRINNSGSSIVNADGSFQINGLRADRVTISLYSAGPGTKRPTILQIDHDGIGLNQGFEIQPGRSISGLRVLISFGSGAIRGTVTFEGGAFPPNARTAISCRREGAQDGSGAQLDSRGHFVIQNLTPGSYEVTLQIYYQIDARPQHPPTPQKQLVTVANGTEAEANLVVDLRPKEGGP